MVKKKDTEASDEQPARRAPSFVRSFLLLFFSFLLCCVVIGEGVPKEKIVLGNNFSFCVLFSAINSPEKLGSAQEG